jgi:phage host-nuclease inhibitor protein Gam
MKQYSTISELVSNTRKKIDSLNSIVDVLLSNYRTASEMLDDQIDYRKHYADQLKDLNVTLSSIIDEHPSLGADRIAENALTKLVEIANKQG